MSQNSAIGEKSNRLINETSPYLLQHAYNPVNWYPWGEEALKKAADENKVILISIGYSACHWCHVMEKESFEDEATAELMNKYFINIKIDREERPDLDHIYMDAVQAISGSGGWPLNVFLTPDTKPFYGGTYFPPKDIFNRASWKDVINAVNQAWEERRDEIMEQAENLTQHLVRSNDFVKPGKTAGEDILNKAVLEEEVHQIFANIMKVADKEWGGFGKAPKFPQTLTIQFLLQYAHFTGNKEALQQALLSIDKMLEGGIYDHIGGGLARYSTDTEWLVPHFEKMLYDNALLVNILCDAYQLTSDRTYEKAIKHTIEFVRSELKNGMGGFFTALDADSEGEEGKYYVWQKNEVDEVLGNDSSIFCDFFNITENGNWEAKNIPRILKKTSDFAHEKGLKPEEFEAGIDRSIKLLFLRRNSRAKPQLDDKSLLGWNALMITALCRAAAALSEDAYSKYAVDCFDFLIDKFKSPLETGNYLHTYKNGVVKYPAFLDDYAYLIQACIHLQEITSDTKYLIVAKNLTEYVLENFENKETGHFFYTGKDQQDVFVRKKEMFDGAIPSGNSIMTDNLIYLSKVFNMPNWYQLADRNLVSLKKAIINYPTSFSNWASLIMKRLYNINEIIVTGQRSMEIRNSILKDYIPYKIIQCAFASDERFPLLTGKNYDLGSNIYLCRNYACLPPVTTHSELRSLLTKKDNN